MTYESHKLSEKKLKITLLLKQKNCFQSNHNSQHILNKKFINIIKLTIK